jgi:peptidyl-prolyl cis-trans isomerase C
MARALAAEPLVHFLAAGLVLYLASTAWQRRHDLYRIEITPARVSTLVEAYRKQHGKTPDLQMRESLVQGYIDDEILYREGARLKLDERDEIVRRRVIQKMRFLAENQHAPAEPSETEIADHYRDHQAQYVIAPAVSFTHIYFSEDHAAEVNAEDRAQDTLSRVRKLNPSRAPQAGDSFPDLYDFSAYGAEQVERLFGTSPLSTAVFEVPVGVWSGPFRSGYGWHLVKVGTRSQKTLAPLAQIREKVRSDILSTAQDRQNMDDYQALRRRFTITRSDTPQ